MAHYKTAHPWDPGYALPDYIRAESPGRAGGVHVTMQLPRGFFESGGKTARPWKSGYALPKYIKREPVGRGAAATMQRIRKTIPLKLPNALGATDEEKDLALLDLPIRGGEAMVQEGEEFETLDLRTGQPKREVLPQKVVIKREGIPGWLLPVGVAVVAAYFVWKG
jgi:hypothetical protein